MNTITKAQQDVLQTLAQDGYYLSEWGRLYKGDMPFDVVSFGVRVPLVREGLISFTADDNTWRISAKGRAALEGSVT